MSESELVATKEKWLKTHYEEVDELIAAGYGNEKSSETRKRAEDTHDPLARRFSHSADMLSLILEERDARLRYHGTLKPIKA